MARRIDLLGLGPDLIRRSSERDLISLAGRREEMELLGARPDLVGYDDDGFDDELGAHITAGDIIGAIVAAERGERLTRQQREALRHAKKSVKRQMRQGVDIDMDSESNLALALRAANKPIVRTEESDTLRMLNFPLGTITVPSLGTADFVQVAQESIRVERLFLYPIGGNFDNLFVVNIFAGRQPQSVNPGLEEPLNNYAFNAVGGSIEGFTIKYGLTLRITILNRTAAAVQVSGKLKGKTLT